MSDFAVERELRAERLTADSVRVAKLEVLGRGDRLSVEDRTALDQANTRIGEIDAELRVYAEARGLSAAASAEIAEPDASAPEARERNFSEYVRRGVVSPEMRAMGEAGASNGTYVVPPGWWQRLQVALKAFGGIADDYEQLVTDSGQQMVWATVDPTTTVGQLVGSQTTTGALGSQKPGSSDGGTANENQGLGDLDYVFGQGVLNAYMYTSGVQKVSFQLANDSAFDLDAFVVRRVGEALGRAKAAAAISGTGTSQPYGIIPALNTKGSAGTIGTSFPAPVGGFVTLKTAGAITTQNGATTELIQNTLNTSTLLGMVAAVDPSYRALGAKWYLNDAQMLGLRAQVDSNGRPLVNLIDGLRDDLPVTRILGFEAVIDQNIPNLTASTTGGPVFGHLASTMVLRTVSQSGLLRLSERYADLLQIGFIGYMRLDIRPNDLRSAVTVKPAAT